MGGQQQQAVRGPTNKSIDPLIDKFVKPLRNTNGNLALARILEKGKITKKQAAEWPDTPGGICPSFSTGYCANTACTFKHFFAKELPSG